MKDLNFIKLNQPTSLAHLALVFMSSFAILLLILNSPHLFSYADYKLNYNEDKENERLTNEYRVLYGHIAVSYPTEEISAENTLSISKINVLAPLLQSQTAGEKEMLTLLKNGVLIFPGSSLPDQAGTTVIIGHSSSDFPWTKYSNVFSLLGKLQAGDLININYNNKTYVYSVSSVHTGSVVQMRQAALNHSGDLLLSSCWPAGTANGRIIVTANLEKII